MAQNSLVKHVGTHLSIPIKPIYPPAIPNLDNECFLTRSFDSVAYVSKSVEYSLSPSGALRSFIKFWILLSMYLAIPPVFIIPVLLFIISDLQQLSISAEDVSQHLFQSLLYLAGGVFSVVVVLWFVRRFLRS